MKSLAKPGSNTTQAEQGCVPLGQGHQALTCSPVLALALRRRVLASSLDRIMLRF